MKKIILAAAISVAMAFTCFAANPESDFDYDLVNKNEVKLLSEQFKELNPTEDYVEITYFNGAEGKDAIIEIPEEIEDFEGDGNIEENPYVAPVVEESPVVETTPAAEEVQAAEETSVAGETPAEPETSVIEEEPSVEIVEQEAE